MEGKNQSVSGNVAQPAGTEDDGEKSFLNQARYRDFYSLTDQLHHCYGDRTFSLRTEPEDEAVHFCASAGLAFPPRDIESLTKNAAGQYVMTTTFMGLAGSSSPAGVLSGRHGLVSGAGGGQRHGGFSEPVQPPLDAVPVPYLAQVQLAYQFPQWRYGYYFTAHVCANRAG